MTLNNNERLDEILGQLMTKTADASYGEWQVVGLPEAKQAIIDWHDKQVEDKARKSKELWLLEVGYMGKTVISHLEPVEAGTMESATMNEIAEALRALGARNIVMDNAYPKEIESLKADGFHIISAGRCI